MFVILWVLLNMAQICNFATVGKVSVKGWLLQGYLCAAV